MNAASKESASFTNEKPSAPIPVDRKIDGVAEVTFRSAVSPVFGRKQNKLAFKDEINVFRRTLLYAGPPACAATPCGVVRRMYWVRSSSPRMYAAAALPFRVRLVGSRR